MIELDEIGVAQKEAYKADYQRQVQRNNESLPGVWSVKKEMGYILA